GVFRTLDASFTTERRERDRELRNVSETKLRFVCEASTDDHIEIVRNVAASCRRRLRRTKRRRDELERGATFVRRRARNELVEQCAKAPDVRARVGAGRRLELLRCHVAR